MSQEPTISIVTVSYNQCDFIRQNIESVKNQNYPKIEHIIVDGGSTDGTLEILKEYPHLVWSSEPDHGQSHALNKGFRKAKGEFLGWINSDDWYEPNVLRQVVEALKEYPVVLGGCEKSTRDGSRIEVNPNVPRNFFDILKYWVMFSTPDQPGVFFRKSALEEVQLAPGIFLDEELDYCMDVELWMRLSKKNKFQHQLPLVTSHFRWYEDSKTGSNMAAAYRETSRIFVRHAANFGKRERSISFVLPVHNYNEWVNSTVDSLSKQIFQEFEVLIVDYGNPADKSRAMRRSVVDLGEKYKNCCIRYCKAWAEGIEDPNVLYAINHAVDVASAPLLVYLEPGVTVQNDFALQVSNLFKIDPYGCALPLKNSPEVIKAMTTPMQGHNFFSVASIFSSTPLGFNFAVRKAAMIELGGIKSWNAPFVALRELLLRLSYKSWSISIDNNLAISPAPSSFWSAEDQESIAVLTNYINAKIISEVHTEFLSDPFAETRAKHGVNLGFTPNLISSVQRVLSYAPSYWADMRFTKTRVALEETVQQHPDFAPGWFFLARDYKKAGDLAKADEIYKQFIKAKEREVI